MPQAPSYRNYTNTSYSFFVIFLSLVHRLFFIARCSVNSIMSDDVQIVEPRLGSILACATEVEHLHRCLLIRVD